MDTFIDGRFDRVEKALAKLIDSITKYHPSIVQAEELRIADDELHKGLKQVEIHQNNNLHIQRLRETSAALDTQIRDTLSSLASTRKDIVTTQTTTYPSRPNYPIAYEELLSYARRISKTTMPPAGTINGVSSTPAAGQTPAGQTPAGQTPAAMDSHPPSAITPSAAPTPSQTQSPAVGAAATNGVTGPSDAQQQQGAQYPQQMTLPGKTELPEGMDRYMNVFSGQLFFPWPHEDKIRSGALAANQLLAERGIEPRGFDPAEEEERKRKEEDDRKEREDKERAEREERERKLIEDRERARQERERQREAERAEAWRRDSTGAAGAVGGQPSEQPGAGAAASLGRSDAAAGEKKQFQFTNLDDLDDDDDDDD